MRVILHEIAHSRAGDKGTLITLSLIPYRRELYPVLVDQVTADRVGHHLFHRIDGTVTRYLAPNVYALNYVCTRKAGDTVTTSPFLDAHGKSLSDALLTLEIELDEPRSNAEHGGDGMARCPI